MLQTTSQQQGLDLNADESSFFPSTYRTVDGEFLVIPTHKFSILVETEVRVKLLNHLQKSTENDPDGISGITNFTGIFKLLADPSVSDDLVEIASMITGRTEDWVEDNLTTTDIVHLVYELCFKALKEDAQEETSPVEDSENSLGMMALIEYVCKTYSWTPSQVLDLSKWQIRAMMKAFGERMEMEAEAMEEATSGKKGRRSRGRSPGEQGECIKPLSSSAKKEVARAKAGETWGADSVRNFANSHGGIKKSGGDMMNG